MKKLLLTTLTLLLFSAPCFAETGFEREGKIKSAIVYHLAHDIKPMSEHVESTPFRICVLGDDPVNSYIREVFDGKSIDERTVEIYETTSVQKQPCSFVFLGDMEESDYQAALRSASALNIPTVENDGRGGAVIALYKDNNRANLRLDTEAAKGFVLADRLLEILGEI